MKNRYSKDRIYIGGVCGMCGKTAETPHLDCEKKADELAIDYKNKMIKMAQTYGINKTFGPSHLGNKMTLDEAENILSNYLDHKPSYDIDEVLENENWWFIPHEWIGVLGFIVEKESKKVFCLGSGLHSIWNAVMQYMDGKVEPIKNKL